MNKNIPSRLLLVACIALLLGSVQPLAAQTVIASGGNYISGSGFYLGTHSATWGLSITYDNVSADVVKFHANRVASWLWENNDDVAGTLPAMRLDQANKLILYNGTSEGVVLSPISLIGLSGPFLKLGGSATLTGDTAGMFTTSGALTVAGNITGTSGSFTGALTVANGITNTNGSVTGGTSGLTFNAGGTTGDIVFNAGGSERVRIKSTGNVGIGTTAPTHKLEVGGQIFASDAIVTAGTNGGFVAFDRTTTGVTALYRVGDISRLWDGAYGDVMAFTGGGQVGIGTTAPAYKFDLRTPGSTASQVHLAASATDAGGYVVSAGDDNMFLSAGAAWNGSAWIAKSTSYGIFGTGGGAFQFYAGTGVTSGSAVALTPRMMIDGSGNVGIGTTTPGVKLDVAGVIRSQGGGFAAWGGGQLEMQFNNQGDGADQHYTELIAQNGVFTGRFVNDAYNLADTWLSVKRRAGSYAVDSVNFPAGNVGVGTTSPARQLHVVGPGQATASGLTDAGNQGGTLYLQDTGGAPYNGGAVLFGASQGYFAGIKSEITNGSVNTGGDLSFETRNSLTDTQLTPRLFIRGDGNVGIGTTNPTQKLSVNGTIRAKEVIVDTGWADYVFDESYRLAPLSEVESHIKAEKHLPGIPSAAEVAEHGVSMGEMQAKLLSKIEELTLHIIAQEKRLAAQDERIAQLEQTNANDR